MSSSTIDVRRQAASPAPRGLCEAVQHHVCRMAADAPLPVAATAVARHVRECAACSRFVDELGHLRRWLASVDRPGTLARRRRGRRAACRAALATELLARLARDLLADARGGGGRPAEERSRDAARLAAVTEGLRRGPGTSREEAAAVDRALRPEPGDVRGALEAAALLDPLGLDVALAWLAHLERDGEHERAHRLTDRWIARLA